MAAERITIHGKTFEKTIPEAEILRAVETVAERITADYKEKNPVFVVVLSGAFVFASDLLRMIKFPCQIAFTKLKSYAGLESTGKIIEQLPVSEDISGRHVVIIEDIVETGYSMQFLKEVLTDKHPASMEICAFSFKPDKLRVKGLEVKYVGMHLPDAFIVGYGLDYNHQGRQLRDIYSLVKD
ncbi:MAG: hypoxanthine phosphoribosyltransferase [Prevotella sp.]|nr:hypoxanthine phosphoribosyltransferase [Prevotella sp.]